MKKSLFLLPIAIFTVLILKAQCPTSDFSISGAACAGQGINFTNTSSGAVFYNWDFCSGDFDSAATVSILDTSAGLGFSIPYCAIPVIEGSNHYAFICNRGGSSIVRADFGNSFNNTPQFTSLGTFGVLSGPSGMTFVKEAGTWYALITDHDVYSKIYKLEFSSGLGNAPIFTSIGSLALNDPRGIDAVTDSAGNIIAAVANYGNSSLTIINFGSSVNNIPVSISNVSVLSGLNIIDVSLAHECGNWYGFVCSFNTNQVVRVDFGNSLLNTPVNAQAIFASGLPSGIAVVNENAKWVACVVNDGNGNLNKFEIGSSLSNLSPTLIGSHFISGQNPLGIKMIKENSDWFGFSTNIGGGFERIAFINACNVNTRVSADTNPSGIIYSTGGKYNVSLASTDLTGAVVYAAKKIAVSPLPDMGFTVQNTCFGDITSFVDTSTITSGIIASRNWDFGDSNTSSAQQPTHTYASPGSYTVTLTDTSASGCWNKMTRTVFISPKPAANFSATSPVCAKTLSPFKDLSTVATGTIAYWLWDFGNGDTSIAANPFYKYPAGGSYNASLTVISDSGCSDSHTLNITVSDAPNAGFTVINTCLDSAAVFNDTTTINSGNIITWQWDFGDTDTSDEQSPVHTYLSAVATYSVSLVAISDIGCSDTMTTAIKINNVPVASFSFAPTTICKGNTVNLTDLSTVAGDSIYSWQWDFGDNTYSSAKSPSHSYSSAGTFDIQLTVSSQTSCSASSTQQVTVVESPTADFGFTSACLGDAITFTDLSAASLGTNLVSWHWDLGDGDTSTLQSPVHAYASAGTFIVTLTVTDNIGCTNFLSSSVITHRLPVAGFTGTSGCSSTSLHFFDTSTSTEGTINSYTWSFDDPNSGASNSSNIPDPFHTFYAAGVYNVSLIITTTFGCADTLVQGVAIQQSSAANFQYLPTCEKQQMIFTNLDTLPALDSLWSWSFGDGGVSFIQSPSHYYFLPGIYNVTLTVTAKTGCVTSITKPVEVKPNPVANFVTAPACLNTPYVLQDISTVSSGSIKRWHWTFDNNDSADIQFPQTTYTDTGDYTITLTVYTDTVGGCTNTVSNLIHVYPLPVANFNYNPLFGSPPLQVNFNNLAVGAAAYSWTFGDGGSSSAPSPSHTYTDTGKFTIQQLVYSIQGCVDSISKVFYVIKPKLDIAVTNVSYQLQNNLFKVTAQVANLGTRDISNYSMQASIQNGATIDEYVMTPLLSGASGITSYEFTAAFKVSAEQEINYYCARALSPNGETDDNPLNNEKCATVSNKFTVVQPAPNPFIDNLQLQFVLPYKGNVTIELFDVMGRAMGTLYDNEANAGGTTIEVNTATLASQLYYCRFTFSDQTLVYPLIKMPVKKQ